MAGLTEEEQIEALKHWWSKYGTWAIVGVLVALAAVVAYQLWNNHEQKVGQAASAKYEQLLDALNVDDPMKEPDKEHISTAKFLAHELEDNYSGTVYAHFAGLYLAKLAVESGDLKEAEKQLKWVLSHGLNDSLEIIVKTRLARVQLGEGKPDEALRTLDGIEPDQYRPSYDELKGDIYHAMGDNEKAREAYERAINALGEGDVRPLLKMKLDQLAPPRAVVDTSVKSGKRSGTNEKGATNSKATGNGAK